MHVYDQLNGRTLLTAHLAVRHTHVQASELLLDCIATFTCTELASYNQFIFYAVVTNILHLERTKLKKKLVDGASRPPPIQCHAANAIQSNHPGQQPT